MHILRLTPLAVLFKRSAAAAFILLAITVFSKPLQAQVPANYSFCASDSGTCSLNGTNDAYVIYGDPSDGNYTRPMLVPHTTTSVSCDSTTFNYTNVTSGTPSPNCYYTYATARSTWPRTDMGVFCAYEGDTCNFLGRGTIFWIDFDDPFNPYHSGVDEHDDNETCVATNFFYPNYPPGTSHGCFFASMDFYNTPVDSLPCAYDGGWCGFYSPNAVLLFGSEENNMVRFLDNPSPTGQTCDSTTWGGDPDPVSSHQKYCYYQPYF